MSLNVLKLALIGFSISSTAFAAPAPKAPLKDSTVVAVVNGNKLTYGEVLQMKNAHPQIAALPIENVFEPIVDNWVSLTVVSDAALSDKIQKDPEYKKMMKDAEKQLLVSFYMSRKVKEMKTKENLQAEYDRYVKDNPPQEEVSAAHILLKTEPEAKDIIKQLNSGADFTTLANEKSIEPGTNGGELGYFTKELMVPEFANAAFAMKKGEVSKKPVKSQYGYHVIKVNDRRMAEPASFQDVEGELDQAYSAKASQDLIKNLRSKAKVKKFDMQGKEQVK